GGVGKQGGVLHHDGTHGRADDLIAHFARLVSEIRPPSFVVENVPGMAYGLARGYLRELLTSVRSDGYHAEARLLDAQWLGFPQARRRLSIIGVRSDVADAPVFPQPLGYRYTIGDALGIDDDAHMVSRPGGFETSKRFRSDFIVHNASEVAPTIMTKMRLWIEWIDPWKADLRRIIGATRPANTLVASKVPTIADAEHRRRLNTDEGKALCGFPPDYWLPANQDAAWSRLGNSVPPPVAAAVGAALAPLLSAR